MLGKEFSHQLPSLGRQDKNENPAILRRSLAKGKALFFQVADHHGKVAAGSENLLGDLGKRHRAEVIKSFQYRELGESQSGITQLPRGMASGSVRGAH